MLRWSFALMIGWVAGLPMAAAAEPPAGAPAYQAPSRSDDGRHLALSVEKLSRGFSPERPFLIWAIGSSYTNKLGSGAELIELLRERFPEGPAIEYRKMVGNAVPWQYIRGWARHLVIPDQPDLVLIYTLGDPPDLEQLIVELRERTTADIVVPTLHVRVPDAEYFAAGHDDRPYWDQVRDICRRYGVELVENRRDWAVYLRANQLPLESLLADNVHQSDYGAHVIRANIAAHFQPHARYAYDPRSRERRLTATAATTGGDRLTAGAGWSTGNKLTAAAAGARLQVEFTGRRIDLVGEKQPGGGTLRVSIDGQPADQADAYFATYIKPNPKNVQLPGRPDPVRDKSPHGVALGDKQTPQSWTITMTSDTGDFEIAGSVTGPDGGGNSSQRVVSNSGQIIVEPELWRRAEGNRTGDTFTFDVYRAAVGTVSFDGPAGETFVVRLAQDLPPGKHTLQLETTDDRPVAIRAFDIYQPPGVAR